MIRFHRPLSILLSLFSVAIITARLDADPYRLTYQDQSTLGASDSEVWKMSTGELTELGGSPVENSGLIDFTGNGVGQPMNDLVGASLTLGDHGLDADIKVLLTDEIGGRDSAGLDFRAENAVPGLSMGNILAVRGRSGGGGGGIPIGALLRHLPEAVMGVLALTVLGSLLLFLRRRFHSLPPVQAMRFPELEVQH
jgi:hypothetical protein